MNDIKWSLGDVSYKQITAKLPRQTKEKKNNEKKCFTQQQVAF